MEAAKSSLLLPTNVTDIELKSSQRFHLKLWRSGLSMANGLFQILTLFNNQFFKNHSIQTF